MSLVSPYIITTGKKKINWGFYFSPRGSKTESKSKPNGGNYPDDDRSSPQFDSAYSWIWKSVPLCFAPKVTHSLSFLCNSALFSQVFLKVMIGSYVANVVCDVISSSWPEAENKLVSLRRFTDSTVDSYMEFYLEGQLGNLSQIMLTFGSFYQA